MHKYSKENMKVVKGEFLDIVLFEVQANGKILEIISFHYNISKLNSMEISDANVLGFIFLLSQNFCGCVIFILVFLFSKRIVYWRIVHTPHIL